MRKTSFKALAIGDACIDEYRFGSILRLNPEAPVPLLTASHIVQREGMALNVSNNLKAFGVEVDIRVPKILSKKVRYVDEKTGKHLLRVDSDIYCEPYRLEEVSDYDAVVVSDYAKGFVQESLIGELRVHFKGPIFVDTKRTQLKSYENVYYKINEIEFSKLTTEPSNLIVTLGSKGCKYQGKVFSGVPVDTLDVCGAGDVFLAALTYGCMYYKSVERALQLANEAAAVSCKHLGTYVLTEEEVGCIS
jgi:D-beta-D-heptose 7-phosphate kinase/D-beta-D-heptose 1-phosphate adenosyltransferase